MNMRIVLLFSLLAVSYITVSWMGSGTGASAAPNVDLSTIPLAIDGWVGENVDINDQTVRVLNAQSFFSRIYREPQGREISLHAANWENPDTIAAAPHHPEVCYAGAGWTLIKRTVTEIPTATGKVPIELILFQKGQQRVVTGHWFRTGDVTYVNYNGFQNQRRRFWGSKFWPNTTKFLIQFSSPSLDAAEDTIKSFAAKVAGASQLKG